MAVTKRGNGYLISVYLGRNQQGKKDYHYETFYAPTKSLAQQREVELRKQLKQSKAGPKNINMTLGEYIDYFFEKKKRTLRNGTIRTYAAYCRRIKPLIGHLQLWTISFDEIDRILYKELSYLSLRYQKNLYDFAKEVIQDAVNGRKVPPDAMIGWEIPRQEKKIRAVYTGEQLKKIADLIMGDNYRYGFVLYLLIVTGARAGEILGLCTDTVNFSKNEITIKRTINLQSAELQDQPKTSNSYRTIVLKDKEMLLFKKHIKENRVISITRNSLIFQTQNGKAVRYSTIQKTWKSILKKADLGFIRIHDIRHSVITYLLEENLPLIKVASLAGQDVNTTARTYAHLLRKNEAVDFSKVTDKVADNLL